MFDFAHRHRRGSEDGFTLVESLIAVGIFALVALFMAGLMGGALGGILQSKQRAVAVADANQALETARSLAYSDVGNVASDPSLDTDPAVATVSSNNRSFGGEPMSWAINTSNHPFNPHSQTITRGATTLTRKVYVTSIDTNADGLFDVKRVTVKVSWDRQGVRGASNEVTAATIVSPFSPGTLGNPPLATPGGPSPTAAPFPPLLGIASARASNGFVEAEAGSGASLDDTTPVNASAARVYGANGHGDNLLNATAKVNCTQQDARVESSVFGVQTTTAGKQSSASADSVSNRGPNTATGTQNETAAGVVPPPLSVSSGGLLGSRTCVADGTTSGATLPSETGTGSLTALSISLDTSSAPLNVPIGTIAALELSGTTAGQSTAQSTPSDKRVNSTASTGIADLIALRQSGIVSGVLNMNAPEGLVHITAFSATANSSSWTAAGSAGVAVDPAKPLTVKIWDAGSSSNLTDQNGGPVVCDSRSGQYCVLTPSTTTGRIVSLDKTFCLTLVVLCQVEVHVDTMVTVNPAVVAQQTLSDGITRYYRTDWAPVSFTTRMYANNYGSTTRALDTRVTSDLGSVSSCSKYGFLAGGC